MSPMAFSPAPSPVDIVHARWKFECPLSTPGPFVEWYMSRLRFGPRLMAVCAECESVRSSRACTDPRTARCGPGPCPAGWSSEGHGPLQSSHGGLSPPGGLAVADVP